MSGQRSIRDYVNVGVKMARRRKGLALLLYAVNAIVSLAVALPMFVVIRTALGQSGYGRDLAGEFNLPVWSDIWNRIFRIDAEGGTVGEVRMMIWFLLFSIPLALLWKAVSSVGVINATRDNGLRGFWEGVGRYGGKSILLGIPYFLLSVISIVGVTFLLATIGSISGTERAVFWWMVVGIPVGILVSSAVLDLMQDYGRIAIVTRDESVVKSFGSGFAWPFRQSQSVRLYASWFAIGAALLLAPVLLDSWMTAGTWLGVIVLVVLQQAVLYLRAAATVGWYTSETEYFEHVRFYDEPLIAEGAREAEGAHDQRTLLDTGLSSDLGSEMT